MRIRSHSLVVTAALAVALGSCSLFSMSARPATDEEARQGDELAARMVQAMGGMDAFRKLRLISFHFQAVAFGITVRDRRHDWDPWRNISRYTKDNVQVFLRLGDRTGRVFVDGTEVTDPAKRDAEVKEAFAAWTNDHYWLVSPYKVFDPGARRAVIDGMLRISFEGGVGLTPGDVYYYKLNGRYVPTGWKFKLENGLRQDVTYEKQRVLEGVMFWEEKADPISRILFNDLKVSTVPDDALFAPLLGK
ncbi:MAG: hypothetical protein AB2A00_09385 [Myxococcota bacterium]